MAKNFDAGVWQQKIDTTQGSKKMPVILEAIRRLMRKRNIIIDYFFDIYMPMKQRFMMTLQRQCQLLSNLVLFLNNIQMY